MSINLDSVRLFRSMVGEDGMEIVNLSLDEIRFNPLNIYRENSSEDESIESLAENILELGQLEPILVYHDESLDDGKKYTLIGGERRTRAMMLLRDNNGNDDHIMANIIAKPENQLDEELMLLSDNKHREIDLNEQVELNKKLVARLSESYEQLCELGRRPKGKKREWISSYLTIKPRQVQEYLTGNLREQNETTVLPEEVETQNEDHNELTSADKEFLKNIAKNIREEIERKVTIKSKKKTVTLSFIMEFDDVPAVLGILGFNEDGIYHG